jgi:hypothetical protein
MTEPSPLAPPASAEAILTLTPPAPAAAVAATAAPKMAPAVPAAAVPGLDSKVDLYLDGLLTAAPNSPDFANKATDVRTMGDQEIRRAAESSNRLLKTPVKALNEGSLSQGSKVGGTLLELRRTVEALDPKGAQGAKKVFGVLPFGDRITDYFRKYQSSQAHLDAILHALYDGQDELRRDNAALNQEKQQLWDTMGRLNQYVYVAERLDARLSAKIAELDVTDPERAKALREDVLFYVRQKHQDLLTQLAVSIQNYLAIDIVIKNNIELIKGVDRATTTTVSALRTAVIVAQALNNLEPDRADVGDAPGQLGADPAAGGVVHDRDPAAAERVRQHLRDHGRDRHLQGAGAGQHGGDDRHAGERGGQVAGLPGPGVPARRAGPGGIAGARRTGPLTAAPHPAPIDDPATHLTVAPAPSAPGEELAPWRG